MKMKMNSFDSDEDEIFGFLISNIKLHGSFPENLRKKMERKSYLTISLFNFSCLTDEDGEKNCYQK